MKTFRKVEGNTKEIFKKNYENREETFFIKMILLYYFRFSDKFFQFFSDIL